MTSDISIDHSFRQTPGEGPVDKTVIETGDQADEKTSLDREHILCRECLHIITGEAERISVDHSHQHVFANPHGLVFEIGCFQTAEGCIHVGPSTTEWSWFKGFSWRIALCLKCQIHVGWLFTSASSSGFYGLILNRLVSSG